jgi:hypothetical protein
MLRRAAERTGGKVCALIIDRMMRRAAKRIGGKVCVLVINSRLHAEACC